MSRIFYIESTGKIIHPGYELKINGVIYPSQIFTDVWTDNQRADIGVINYSEVVPESEDTHNKSSLNVVVSNGQAVGTWLMNAKPQIELDELSNAAVVRNLEAIVIQSVRGLREWVAGQVDAPQELKDHEINAIAERAKLK